MSTPEVSVVMSVYNGAQSLVRTLDSILAQQAVELELIVIDDGCDDGSGRLLDELAARHPRMRVVHQDNTGLTRALIRGCGMARGAFIARHDAGGDVSMPGRLARQAAIMRDRPECTLTSCGTRFVGPEREVLFAVAQQPDELEQGLARLHVDRIRGPSHHGSTMFRRAAYERVGGYRAAFRFAQDLDLWLRLSEVGRCIAEPELLYEAQLTMGSISHRHRPDQIRIAARIISCAAARRSGGSEAALLADIPATGQPTAKPARLQGRLQAAEFYYFVGSLLQDSSPSRSAEYFIRAFRANPLALAALGRYVRLWRASEKT